MLKVAKDLTVLKTLEELRAKDQKLSLLGGHCKDCGSSVNQRLVQTKIDVLKQVEHKRAVEHLPPDFKCGRMAPGPNVCVLNKNVKLL